MGIQRHAGQKYTAEIAFPGVQQLFQPAQMVPVVVCEKEEAVHSVFVPLCYGFKTHVQRGVSVPDFLVHAAAIDHQDTAVPAAEHDAFSIFHIVQFNPQHKKPSAGAG